MKSRKQVRRPRNKSKKFREINGGGGCLSTPRETTQGIVAVDLECNQQQQQQEEQQQQHQQLGQATRMRKDERFVKRISELINAGVDVNSTFNYGSSFASILYILVDKCLGYQELTSTISNYTITAILMLVAYGADPYSKNGYNGSVMSIAEKQRAHNLVEILKLKRDNAVIVGDALNTTLLFLCKNYKPKDISQERMKDNIIYSLYYAGADFASIDSDGNTAFHHVCKDGVFNPILNIYERSSPYALTIKNNDGYLASQLYRNKDVSNIIIKKYPDYKNLLNEAEKIIREKKNATASVLNSITTGEGKNRKLLAPNVLDNISEFVGMLSSRPLTAEERKRSQDGRDKRNAFRSVLTLNEKKADGKLLPRELLDKIHGFDGSRDDPEFKKARDNKKGGGKRKTNKRKTKKRKTRKK
tara:strand:+ start:4911 stop:6158 length:1248 start_codon:yes stop_codon:yes gene_type:complete